MREYFHGPSPNHSTLNFPPSPPATPTRLPRNKQESELLPTYAALQGRRTSEAYAHRRTSTTTIIRLAVTSARAGALPLPTKIISTFLLFLSLLYLASFVPYLAPLAFQNPRNPSMVTAPNPFVPAYSEKVVPAAAVAEKLPTKAEPDSPIGDTAQRQAWSQHFDHRVPPHLAAAVAPIAPMRAAIAGDADVSDAPPVEKVALETRPTASFHGELMREILSTGGAAGAAAVGVRRKGKGRGPNRLGGVQAIEMKQVDIPAVEEDLREVGLEEDVDEVEESAVDAQRAAVSAAAEKARQKSALRMEKMRAAKEGSARVGAIAPLDSSAQQVEDSHVFVKGGQGRKKQFKGGRKLSAEDADLAKPKEITAAVGNGHPKNQQVSEPIVAANEPEEDDVVAAMQPEEEGFESVVDEEWAEELPAVQVEIVGDE